MSKYYIGLGSNLGDRRKNLEAALQELSQLSVSKKLRVASLYETPAVLREEAPAAWNRPFWNTVAEMHFEGTPDDLLRSLQNIELKLGRVREEVWAPRVIDLDILWAEGIRLQTPHLKIPHVGVVDRAFVLDPLAEIAPEIVFGSASTLDLARAHRKHQPRLMGILNLTPDSFSDGGALLKEGAVDRLLTSWEESAVSVLDVGAESTRPGASLISSDEEWSRLKKTTPCHEGSLRGPMARSKNQCRYPPCLNCRKSPRKWRKNHQ